MKRLLILCLGILVGFLLIFVYVPLESKRVRDFPYSQKVEKTQLNPSTSVKIDTEFGKIPLYFIPNQGQVNEEARFYAKTSRYTLWLTKEGLVFDSVRPKKNEEADTPRLLRSHPSQEGRAERDVSRLIFLDANANPEMLPVDLTGHRVNYFKGNDPAKWQKGIRTSKAVLYKDIYRNIDLKVYGNEKQVEYDWIVKPGGNPRDIRFEYKDVKAVRVDNKGDLLIKTQFGKLVHKKPVSYQVVEGSQITIESEFRKIAKNNYGFRIHEYSKDHELIIDPVVSLENSMFLGGSNYEEATGIYIDSSGQIYVTGSTVSSDFPLQHPYQGLYNGNEDVFITKFNSEGSGYIYSTYLGGSSFEMAEDIAVTINGYAYITGFTDSYDFPAINSSSGERDAFISVFDTCGNLKYSRYLGGSGSDTGNNLAVDNSDNGYVIGRTSSIDFPILNPYQKAKSGSNDVFISKIHYDTDIIYSTYLGGSANDGGYGIDVDQSGSFYVTGYTFSNDFPLKTPYLSENNGGSAFVTRFKPDGSDLVYSTYLGEGTAARELRIAVDNSDCPYVAGHTYSTGLATKNAYQEVLLGDFDLFLTKLKSDGSGIVYFTYLGGSNSEYYSPYYKWGLSVDSSGCAYVSGSTQCTDFPVNNSFQTENAGRVDVFITKFEQDGSDIVYSTYLGGSGYDLCQALAIDNSGHLYLAGSTNSINFPGRNANGSGIDAFIVKLSFPFLLNIKSLPESGLPITVTPNDIDGNGSGNTDFTRIYNQGETVTLTAPENFNDKVFYKWAIDGVDNFNPAIQVIMDNSLTVTAVYQTPVEIVISRTHLYFGANTSGMATGDQTFIISKSGESTLDWSITDNASWLNCSPTSGTNSGEVTVSVNAAGLAPGTYQGTIAVSAPNAINSPRFIDVTLAVYLANTGGVPFGYFETPPDNAYVYSSIPVTGWALDDIGVESVKIYRQDGSDLIHIGDAVFVEGARPDVELAYPTYPQSYRAGWGYMMLTNFLPGGGNGTFVIHAIAEDKEGNKVTLGKKIIICDNAHAVRPFGAIDTPAQGGTASGSSYINFGWVLTPQPNTIPTNGSTIIVWIDSMDIGHPVYNNYRSDIAALFPGYANSNGAVGYFYIDTTQYENGVHTIQWTALDSAGNVDGIGSRYFMIQNTGESTAQSVTHSAAGTAFNVQRSYPMFNVDIEQIPVDYSRPIRVKKGYKENIKPEIIYPDKKGLSTVQIEELERVVIYLAGLPGRGGKGFQLVGDRLSPLPIGSTFDRERGIFYWQPGPGFIGSYQLVFIEEKPNREMTKKFVNVKIVPKFMKGKSKLRRE